MNNVVLLVFPALLVLLMACGAEYSGRGKLAPEYLSMEQCKMIRGTACFGIILHHLTQKITGFGMVYKGPVTVFNYAGILFTALFFFFSGYGLIVSFETKPDYLKSFLKRRLPSVLIPFWIINLLWIVLERFVYGIHKDVISILCDLIGLTLINGNGWFIVEIVILYIVFYTLFKEIRNKDTALGLLCVFTLVLIIWSFFRGHDPQGNQVHWFRGEWWFNSTAVFLAGLLYARFRKKADRFFNKYYPAVAGVTAVLFVAAFRAAVYAVDHLGYYHDYGYRYAERDGAVTLLAQSSACLLFTLLVLLLNMRITLHSRILKYFGRISTELFLIHGFFVYRVFGNVHMSDPLLFAAVTGCSVACAAVISPCIRRIAGGVLKSLSWQKPLNNTLESQIAQEKRNKRARLVKTAAAAVLGAVCLIMLYNAGRRFVFARWEYEEECRKISEAAAGSEVLWGYYETDRSRIGKERLTWIVIKKEEDRACLLTKEGIAGSYYNQKHETVNWEESDLRALLNSDAFTGIFSRYEAESIVRIDGDLITLLTPEEAEEVFHSDQERELSITSAAEQDGTNINRMSKSHNWDMKGYRSSWWWLRGTGGHRDIMAPVVTVDGTISAEEKNVNRPGGAVRPLIWVKLSGEEDTAAP